MLTSKDWMKLRDYNKQIALRVQAKLPGDWFLTLEEVEGAVYDSFVKLLGCWKPGSMSQPSFCWQYGEKMTLQTLMKEYRRLKNQFQTSDDFEGEDDGEQFRQYGKGETRTLSADEREIRDEKMQLNEIFERAKPEDKEIMTAYMEGRTLGEIGEKLGITKQAVLKRLRKYGEENRK